MNVQPRDLAYVVAPYAAPGRNSFVTVLRRAAPLEFLGDCTFTSDDEAWVVEGWVRGDDGLVVGPQVVISDVCLRRVPPAWSFDLTVSCDELTEAINRIS